MGKVKSAIITALLVAAIVVLTLFATVSIPNLPGSDGTERYNSFISSISLGSEFTGDATLTFYPEGVMTEDDYNRAILNDKKREEYGEKYEFVEKVGLYIQKDKLKDDEDNDISGEFAASVKKDAEIISDRFSQKGYSSYSVSIVDTYGIKITVPTTFSYAAYKNHESSTRTAILNEIGNTMKYLPLEGGFDLRSSSDSDSKGSILTTKYKDDFNSYFKSAKSVTRSGSYVIRINLTDEGVEKLREILNNQSAAYLYVGDTNLNLPDFTGLDIEKSLYFTSTVKSSAEDYSIIIDSVARGNMLTNKYSDNINSSNLITTTPVYGEYAAVWLACLVLVIVLFAALIPIFKYRILGVVNAIMVLAYSAALTTAIMLTGVELTIGGIFTALLGLALMSFSNFFTFEAVRRETAVGRTISASVKLGYKKSMFGVLDIHIILVIASALMALIGAGELAACGLIFLIATVASFVLYWLTRFMWYVISSPVRNKFDFCGFEREVEEDD